MGARWPPCASWPSAWVGANWRPTWGEHGRWPHRLRPTIPPAKWRSDALDGRAAELLTNPVEGLMEEVHLFVSTGRFRSLAEVRAYTDETYDDDGNGLPSPFMAEVGLDEYEPNCIEAYPSASGRPVPLAELLAGASYWEQWLPPVAGTSLADAAIFLFLPTLLYNTQS